LRKPDGYTMGFTHLEGVLGDAGQAVVHGSPGAGVDDDLADLVRLAELRGSVHLHDAHEGWGGGRNTFKIQDSTTLIVTYTYRLCGEMEKWRRPAEWAKENRTNNTKE